MKKDCYIQIRVTEKMKKDIESVARYECTTVSALVTSLIFSHIKLARTSDDFLRFLDE